MPNASSDKPELVIGFVGAAGTDLDLADKAVASALTSYGYDVVPIRLSKLMHDVKGGERLAEAGQEDDRIWEHMDAGDGIRNRSRRNDAIAGLAVGSISDLRKEVHDGAPAMNTAPGWRGPCRLHGFRVEDQAGQPNRVRPTHPC